MTRVAVLLLAIVVACESRTVDSRITAADRMLDTRPDSALCLLLSTDTAQLSAADRAHRRVSLVRAYERLNIEFGDTAIRPALDWYERHGTAGEKALAWYCYGLANESADVEKAIQGYTAALMYAEKADGCDRLAAVLYHTLGALYSSGGYDWLAEEYFAGAAERWRRLGCETNARFSRFMQAISAYSDLRYAEAAEMLDEIDDDGTDAVFSALLRCYRIILHLSLGDRTPEQLLACRDGIVRQDLAADPDRLDLRFVRDPMFMYDVVSAMVFYEAGRTDSAAYYVRRALEGAGEVGSGTVSLYRIAADIAFSNGDLHTAYAMERQYARLYDSISRADRRLQIDRIESRERERWRTALLRTRHRYNMAFTVLGCALVLAGAFAAYRRAVRRRDRRLNEYLALLDSYRESQDSLVSRLNADDARQAAVKELLEGRIAAVRAVAAAYYTYGDSDRLVEKMKELTLSEAMLRDIERMTDMYNDRIVSRLRVAFTGWTKRCYDFSVLIMAGFSPQEICVMMGMTLNGVYTLKSKLKRRIACSPAEDREAFARFFE